MAVNVVQWRVEIGVFDALCDVKYTTKFSCSSLTFTLLLLFMSGDIDPDLTKLILVANLENLLADITSRNPHFMLLLCGFNAKLKTWFINDQSSSERTLLESLTLLYGMKQLIAEIIHVLDLIFISYFYIHRSCFYEPAKLDNGCWSSTSELHPKCHHQVKYAKLNFANRISSTVYL